MMLMILSAFAALAQSLTDWGTPYWSPAAARAVLRPRLPTPLGVEGAYVAAVRRVLRRHDLEPVDARLIAPLWRIVPVTPSAWASRPAEDPRSPWAWVSYFLYTQPRRGMGSPYVEAPEAVAKAWGLGIPATAFPKGLCHLLPAPTYGRDGRDVTARAVVRPTRLVRRPIVGAPPRTRTRAVLDLARRLRRHRAAGAHIEAFVLDEHVKTSEIRRLARLPGWALHALEGWYAAGHDAHPLYVDERGRLNWERIADALRPLTPRVREAFQAWSLPARLWPEPIRAWGVQRGWGHGPTLNQILNGRPGACLNRQTGEPVWSSPDWPARWDTSNGVLHLHWRSDPDHEDRQGGTPAAERLRAFLARTHARLAPVCERTAPRPAYWYQPPPACDPAPNRCRTGRLTARRRALAAVRCGASPSGLALDHNTYERARPCPIAPLLQGVPSGDLWLAPPHCAPDHWTQASTCITAQDVEMRARGCERSPGGGYRFVAPVTDADGGLIGWRAWRVGPSYPASALRALRSPTQGTLWAHPWMRADRPITGPGVRYVQGIHACWTRSQLEAESGYDNEGVFGEVRGYGTFQAGKEGWRAEEVVIISLDLRREFTGAPELAAELARRYGVPVTICGKALPAPTPTTDAPGRILDLCPPPTRRRPNPMHIEVRSQGEIIVVGSRRLSARLHGLNIRVMTCAQVIDRLIETHLLAVADRPRAIELAARLTASTPEDWQCVCAALHASAEEVDALVRARAGAATTTTRRFTLAEQEAETRQQAWVMNFRLDCPPP